MMPFSSAYGKVVVLVKKIQNYVQPTITKGGSNSSNNSSYSIKSAIMHQGSGIIRPAPKERTLINKASREDRGVYSS
jgi:hypothetical protein